MLKTNTKQVLNAFVEHIKSYEYTPESLKADMKAVGGATTYQQGVNLAEGGCFLCYYGQVRDFLIEALQETEAEANRFTDEQGWKLYCHLIGRACEKMTK